jgi:signal transduction histidine kinase
MARYIAFAVVTSLVAGMVSVVLYRDFTMRRTLETWATDFAALVSVPLVQVSIMYGGSELEEPVRSWVVQLLDLNQDIEKLEIVLPDGGLVFFASRNRVDVWPLDAPAPGITDPKLLEVLDRGEGEAERVKVDGRSVYRVVVPGEEKSRSYTLSLVATCSYHRVEQQLSRGILFLGLALILGLVLAERVSAALSRGITRDIEELHEGVRMIRAGRLDVRVRIQSEDEIQELAEAFNDMTEDFQQSISRLRRVNQELQALDQVKVDLVANVSHELRTPLTALKGFLELLDEGELGELGPEAHRAVTVCRKNVDRLALRVEDLVQLSQMEKSWPIEPSMESIDLAQLVSMIVEIHEAPIRSKDLSLALEAPDDLPAIVGNTEQIERVVINLLDNAVKFTPRRGHRGGGARGVRPRRSKGVLIRVVDSGIGIPPSELVRVFDRFHQVDPSIRRRFGGMGLGLALVHHIVESHRGVVWAESEPGQGASLFRLASAVADSDPRHGEDRVFDTLHSRVNAHPFVFGAQSESNLCRR